MKVWRLIFPLLLLGSMVVLPYDRVSAQSPPPPPAVTIPWQANLCVHGAVDTHGAFAESIITWGARRGVPIASQRVVTYRLVGRSWQLDTSPTINVRYTSFAYATVEGLATGATYRFAIRLAGLALESLPSRAFVPTASVPGDPISPSATPGNQSATLDWLPRLGADINHYLVQVSTTDGKLVQYVDGVLNPPVAISGLTNGTTYNLAVRLVDSHGMLSVGASTRVTPQAPIPPAPTLAANRTSVEPGDTVTLTGSYFPAGVQVSVAMGVGSGAESGNYGTATVTSGGSFSLQVTLSRNPDGSALHAGAITLVAHTASWDKQASLGLQVVTLSANRTSMKPGDHVVLTGQGFTPGVWLTIGMGTLTSPVGGNYATVLPNASGQFTIDLTLTQYPNGTPLHADTIVLQAHNATSSQKASAQIQILAAPTLTANRTSMRPGDSVTLTGWGFTPGTSVAIGMGTSTTGVAGNYGTATVDANGRFVITTTLSRYPDGSVLRPGTILLQAYNWNWSEVAGVQVQVLATPSLTVNRSTVRPGDQVTLTGQGYTPGVWLTLNVLNASTGVSWDYGTVLTDSNGYFTTTATLDRYPDGSAIQAGVVVLTARTADGAETASAQVQVVGMPGQPANISAQLVNGQVLVSWTAPANGGSPIVQYRVIAYLAGTSTVTAVVSVAGTSTSAAISGLTSGLTYTFTVQAFNAVGAGIESARSNPITLATAPGSVRSLTISAGDQSVAVSWTAPLTDGGMPISAYQVTASDGVHAPIVAVVSGTSVTLTGLTNGTAYTVSVVAINSVGHGQAATAVATPRNASPSLTIPTNQAVQYGDPMNLAVSATDADPGDHLTFSATGLPTGLTLTDKGNRSATITGASLVPAGSYAVTISVSDGHNAAVVQGFTITVTLQDTTVQPTGIPNVVKVKSVTSSATSITLHATIRHTRAGSLGNLANATPVTYTLKPMGSGVTYSRTATTTITAGALATRATFRNLPVGVYRVIVSVGGTYYTGSGNSLFAVASPLTTGSVRGTGTLTTYGVSGDLNFKVKVLKNGTLQSNFRYVHHEPSGDFTLTSTSVKALVLKGGRAYFQGTGTLNGVPGYRFAAAVTDKGHPGLTDRFALWLIDPAQALVAHCTFSATDVSLGDMIVVSK